MRNEYLLLTPGPLSTSETVREAMLKDWCTWDDEYNKEIVEVIRSKLVTLATNQSGYTSVLMQGSGTASVEATIGSAIPSNGKLLVVDNGAYGARMAEIAGYLNISCETLAPGETSRPSLDAVEALLQRDSDITHLAVVHCETTTGMLSPIKELISLAKRYNKVVILDAMSSFGGIQMDIGEMGVDFMISSANKCIQGVPGFGFVIAKQSELEKCNGLARSLSLDLYAQWKCMQDNHGKWRFTSPTHTVRAFYQALLELESEGGIEAREARYTENQTTLVQGMRSLGFAPLVNEELHSPIITSFYSPTHSDYQFKEFYNRLKEKGFVIYPGKVSNADCFRIGNIGEVYPEDIKRLIIAVKQSMYWEVV
ncbi:2-aminoethylphosphonate--pyruvate transaminase [Vibrio breoganii]|uniref:2-aminoethylphosphonate--pyruvate transaminase n=1 Tax=Vibrio breoganii TaxID=553239 RepID=UPI000C8283DC|nr:2-aminoethylphosphonate--pyruvate transaminase [Vibrio breoganii]PMG88423.1 2-aminoethylphosphonate--pyruvate transaminase [Vibrio breoganii]PMK32876.1 2-aminoethylphosphonate--pyruvate transaminase [Vibrio breoganii]PML38193.1 2-aminoethylphosphonate--pyruvate transaminase [Vibrio breoganii]PML60379.1 2-aminoethylphosphonate--pyruvate transaminase [Vibrio breoganii]PMM87859.1 2-aminoethylphosphonate--pyruvate transaminase [Vibrio breoganii]